MPVEPRYRKGDKIGGRFLVHQALAGGMGEVYLCLDLRQDTPVALKTFQSRFMGQQKIREYFEREAATWVALEKHPHIVRCYHLEKVDAQPFLLLEWVSAELGKGTDLRSWLRQGALAPRVATQVAIDLCRGLNHAAQKVRGLVHGDLKPENILMAQGGVAKITDFGLAHVVFSAGLTLPDQGQSPDGRRHLTSAGGTPPYMAPELWLAKDVDARTDIYATGCMVFELLTGRLPFEERSATDMRKRHLDSVPPRLTGSGGVEASLSAVVHRCLAKEKNDRYPSVDDLLESLTQVHEREWGPPRTLLEGEQFTAQDHHNRGVTYHTLGMIEQSLDDFDEAFRLDPNLALSVHNRGIVRQERGNPLEALDDFNEAIRLDSNFAQAYLSRGTSLAALGRHAEALIDWDQSLRLDPTLAKAYSNRGNARLHLGQIEQALADANEAIRLDPTRAESYSNRGLILAMSDKWDEALIDYNESIRLDPDMAKAYFNRGNACATLSKHEQALGDFNEAIRLSPDFAMAFHSRGKAHAALEDYPHALSDFSETIRLEPTFAQAHYHRGVVHGTTGQRQQAIEAYTEAIRLDPDDFHAYNNRGAIHAERGDHEQALADIQEALRIDPASAQAYANRAAIYTKCGEHEKAFADSTEAIRLEPTFTRAHYNRGTAGHALGDHDRALCDLSEAIRLDPKHALAYMNRGVVHAALGQDEEALADFSEAIRVDPTLGRAYVNIGVWYSQRGDLDEALTFFERAAVLGEASGAHFASRVKSELESGPDRPAFSAALTSEMVEAFANADSRDSMEKVVRAFPVLLTDEALDKLEQLVAQEVPPEEQLPFRERLACLHEIAAEHGQ
jgi:tetratricopeptide (TPR) repeat protein